MLYPDLSHLLSSGRDTMKIGLWYFGGDLPFLMWGWLGFVFLGVDDIPVGGLKDFLVVIVEEGWKHLRLGESLMIGFLLTVGLVCCFA